jgi:putative hydrolases of HD superfamily
MSIPPEELEGVLAFLRAAESLKNQPRTAWTSAGRRESVAEHTWRLCLMALLLGARVPGIDVARLLRICIVHDLGEAIGGDISAVLQAEREAAAPDGTGAKAAQERADLLQLLAPLPVGDRQAIVALWDEYEAATTPEARLAKGLDKLETILQHNQGDNPAGFDYRFNLEYGRRYTSDDPLLSEVRSLLDAETEHRARLGEDRG